MSIEPYQAKGSPSKRKRLISDFFTSKRRCSASPGTSKISSEPPAPVPPAVPGLTILRHFVPRDEEGQLLAFVYDPAKCTWRTDQSRRCMHFGGTYCLYKAPNQKAFPSSHHNFSGGHETAKSKPQVLQAPPMSSDLSWLIDRFVAKKVFGADKIPQYCIVC